MAFQDKLRQLVEQVEGGLACILMGKDGLPIGSYQNPQTRTRFDSETFGVEFTSLLHSMSQIANQTQFSQPTEFTLQSPHQTAIFRFISREYFLLLTLTPDGNAGKGRYLLRTAAPSIQDELFS